jgi:Protein of unknown function (DUF2975)
MPFQVLPAVLRARSARLARGLTVLLVVLAAMLLSERFSAVGLSLLDEGLGGEALRRFGVQLAAAIPEACYLMALWWVRAALVEFAHGAFHTPVIAKALQRVGAMLTAGAAIALFAVPSLQRLFGFDPGYLIAYDIGSAVLCALGLSLAMLAHVLERAAAVQAELDEIF